MVALATDRDTQMRGLRIGDDSVFTYIPVAAATTIYQGAMVGCNAAGDLVPFTTAVGIQLQGRAEEQVVNAGAAGAKSCRVRRGCFLWANAAGGDAVLAANRNDIVYGLDDQTVTITATGRSVAGLVDEVTAAGVWVHMDPRNRNVAP